MYFHAGWIGSIGFALTFFLCPVAGRLCDRFGCRPVVIAGFAVCCLSLFLTSFVKKVDLFFATYSVIFGIGSSCCRMGNFLITAKYFKKHKSLPTGFVSAGSGIGLLVLGPINQVMIDNLGLGGAYRVLSGVMVLGCVLALTYDPNVNEDGGPDSIGCNQLRELKIKQTEKERQANNGTRKRLKIVLDFSVWKLPTFTVIAVCSFLFSIVLGLPLLHLVSSINQSHLFLERQSAKTFRGLLQICESHWFSHLELFKQGNVSVIGCRCPEDISHS